MRFCIYGAGAIGGYLAVELATAGHDVCVIARGDHLKAIQKRGLILRIGGREKIAQVAADENPQRFGFQDVVVCALKAHQANTSAPDFALTLRGRLTQKHRGILPVRLRPSMISAALERTFTTGCCGEQQLAAKTREDLLDWRGRTNVEGLVENPAEFIGTSDHSFIGNFSVTGLNNEPVID